MEKKRGPLNKTIIKCPSCGIDNILGSDRCKHCLLSLMQRGLPKPEKNDLFQSTMMTASISDIIKNENLIVASPNDSVQKVVMILQKEQKSCVIVSENKKLIGILSLRDLLYKIVKKHKHTSQVKVRDAMTPNPEFVKDKDSVAFAVNKMAAGGFRHVPVIADDGSPLGIVSIKDVLEYFSHQKILNQR